MLSETAFIIWFDFSAPLHSALVVERYGLADGCRWRVLVDGAAAAPTMPLRFSEDMAADFAAVSFYKMFG